MSRRIGLATLSALLGLVVSVVAFGRAPGAIATQGQPVIAGQTNTETQATVMTNTSSEPCPFLQASSGLVGCGTRGVEGGSLSGTGVEGHVNTGTGVFGWNSGETGIGVKGQTGGVGSAVYGVATGSGVGVFGDTTNGTGVIARSANGSALDVRGKLQLSRSGTATIAGTAASPKSSITVTNVALSAKSLILVTEQKNVGGVWVRAAVPNTTNSRFTVFLNKNVSVSFPVAWMVVEKP